jgi:hypothetical protein
MFFPSESFTALITLEWVFEFQKKTLPSFLWIFNQTLGIQPEMLGNLLLISLEQDD